MSSAESVTIHKLHNSWSIYEQVQFHTEKDKKKGYFESFDQICTFSTAEGFWLNWNRIPTVTYVLSLFVNPVVSFSTTERTELLREWMSVSLRISLVILRYALGLRSVRFRLRVRVFSRLESSLSGRIPRTSREARCVWSLEVFVMFQS